MPITQTGVHGQVVLQVLFRNLVVLGSTYRDRLYNLGATGNGLSWLFNDDAPTGAAAQPGNYPVGDFAACTLQLLAGVRQTVDLRALQPDPPGTPVVALAGVQVLILVNNEQLAGRDVSLLPSAASPWSGGPVAAAASAAPGGFWSPGFWAEGAGAAPGGQPFAAGGLAMWAYPLSPIPVTATSRNLDLLSPAADASVTLFACGPKA